MPRLPFSLASSIAAPLFGLAAIAWPATDADAATRVVSNCNDSGSGSLRNVVASALSGDTIDLRGLSCSRIILTSGQIAIPQAALTVLGRDRYELTIDGNRSDRVFLHTGIGTLRLERVSIAYGRRTPVDVGNDFGGCIRSDGNIELHRARVHGCAVQLRRLHRFALNVRRRNQRSGQRAVVLQRRIQQLGDRTPARAAGSSPADG